MFSFSKLDIQRNENQVRKAYLLDQCYSTECCSAIIGLVFGRDAESKIQDGNIYWNDMLKKLNKKIDIHFLIENIDPGIFQNIFLLQTAVRNKMTVIIKEKLDSFLLLILCVLLC